MDSFLDFMVLLGMEMAELEVSFSKTWLLGGSSFSKAGLSHAGGSTIWTTLDGLSSWALSLPVPPDPFLILSSMLDDKVGISSVAC